MRSLGPSTPGSKVNTQERRRPDGAAPPPVRRLGAAGGSSHGRGRAGLRIGRRGLPGVAGACTAASSSGERDRGGTGTAPEDGRGEGGGGGGGARKGSVAPSAAVPRTSDQVPGATACAPGALVKGSKGQPFTRRTSASSCRLGWDWTRTHTHTRWGSVGFPPWGLPCWSRFPWEAIQPALHRGACWWAWVYIYI